MSTELLERTLAGFAETQNLTLADWDRPSRFVAARMGALGKDVWSAVEMLLRDYEAAQQEVSESRHTMPEMEWADIRRFFDAQRRVETAYKSVFIYIRAYQDAVYGFLVEATQTGRAGKYTSMSDALKKKGNPVTKLLDDEFPDYRDWFERWKDDRDRIKIGASFMLVFDGDNNLALQFTYPVEPIHPSKVQIQIEERQIGLNDMIKGLDMSARLTLLAFQHVDGEVIHLRWPSTDATS